MPRAARTPTARSVLEPAPKNGDGGVAELHRDHAAEDLRAIIDYLGVSPSDQDMQELTGLDEVTISAGLAGGGIEEADRRSHVAVVAAVVGLLKAGRQIATGETDRGKSASGWLHSAQVETSLGLRTPLEILSDPVLAERALNDLMA